MATTNTATAPVGVDEPVLVVDFGGQYAQLIARRIRELGVFAEVVSPDRPIGELAARTPAAIVLSGGPDSVYDRDAPGIDDAVFALGVPVLGICYGMQLMAQRLGGRVERTGSAEFGRAELRATEHESALLAGLPDVQDCWMSHRDSVVSPPPGATVIAGSDGAPIAAFEHASKGWYGVQFHPEVAHTPHGQALLENFITRVVGVEKNWTAETVIVEQVRRIREQVGDARVLCALSGGVDSAVAAALVHRAVGDQLTCLFVDHGLLRQGEAAQVVETFERQLDVPLIHVDASEMFLGQLAGVEDPEHKRRIIGEQFVRTFEREAAGLGNPPYLVQGTLYSDVIESGGGAGGRAATIKSHHNVGGLPDDMAFELVEPLRMLFKDEVRRVGASLGLPREILWRHPFPGPGLAIRIIGEVTPDRIAAVRAADAIVREEITAAGLDDDVWQCFAVLPAVRSVGVQGDARTYAYPIIVRAVTSEDAMTADWARLPYDVLERLSSRIINEVAQVNRVALDITSKPPATIEWE